jgi:hypothetical protein
VHSCDAVSGAPPEAAAGAGAAEFAADVSAGAAAGTVSPEVADWAPVSTLFAGVDPELLKATVPAVAAPPAATKPASDQATAFIERRFKIGRFGIFLFLGVARCRRGRASYGRLASNAAKAACSPASSPSRADAAAALST